MGIGSSSTGKLGAVLATQGNFNNDIGMPLTLLKLRATHQYAVIEMGILKIPIIISTIKTPTTNPFIVAEVSRSFNIDINKAKAIKIRIEIVKLKIPQPKNFELGIFRFIPTIEWASVLK